MKRLLLSAPLTLLVACSGPGAGESRDRTADAAAPDAALSGAHLGSGAERPRGWLAWRGPNQNGTSLETGLVDSVTVGGEHHLWSYPIAGRGTPVISNGRVFGLGYDKEGPELEEVLFCLDEKSGELLWEHRWSDFISDTVYSRYAIGAPTIDPETGNVFSMTGAGLVHAFTPDGEQLWQVSTMESLGRLTFPNGRTGAPVIVDDLVIMHFIFAAWGPLGPASDRFYAFDKHTGETVWASTPSGRPIDGSFSTPIVEVRGGKTLLYAGLGGGKAVCVDARTGDPVWRFPFSNGGLNCSCVIHGDKLVVIHGKENLDTSATGRMIALDLTKTPGEDGTLAPDAELWRNELCAFTSSPILVGDRVYQTSYTGDLACVDVETGKILWHEKLEADQLHASPLAADGKLYVPMTSGAFFIVRPSDDGMELLDKEQLEGSCLGAPAIANGRVYVHTTTQLYCFGTGEGEAPPWPEPAVAKPGKPERLQVIPYDAAVRVGETISYRVRELDANGLVVRELPADEVEITPAPVLASGKPGVGMTKATHGDLAATARVRVVPAIPSEEGFEGTELTEMPEGGDAPFAFPPGHWLGGRMKWQIVDLEGNKVAARRLDNPLFQRTMTLFGHADDSNYTLEADVMSDGNRRTMCSLGLVNQRYLIKLRGNHQELEVTSNEEHLKVGVPFKWKRDVWYRLKTRVDLEKDGAAIVRAKVWPKGEDEPVDWTIEVRDPYGHTHGAAGIYGFTPQSRFTAYIDNITVTPND